ncbi:hypothetical protein A8W25_20290 [Streptomyces sp. ERV7]|uniref:hypothetical protein n=1 Tax=Streptomyces sp. ERV7 TaxID=1322334 RepID=UPI0007F4E309|nr:hypothetical protein [Streptomyces sp. ERV7]OAR25012.1 hypothetical protein A8W25_20290 [Streptomyces sp. ERV7]
MNFTSIRTTKVTDRSVVATCPLGSSFQGTGLSTGVSGLLGLSVVIPSPLASLPVRNGNERPTQAPEAAVVKGQAEAAYAVAAAGAGAEKKTKQHQTTQHHTMWAFRGLEPWSDPA